MNTNITALALDLHFSKGSFHPLTSFQTHLNWHVNKKKEMIDESIDINYKQKYVNISTPAHNGVQPISMSHDYDQVITL